MSLCSGAWEPQPQSPGAETTVAHVSRACALQEEKLPQWEAHAQQWRPSTTKNKYLKTTETAGSGGVWGRLNLKVYVLFFPLPSIPSLSPAETLQSKQGDRCKQHYVSAHDFTEGYAVNSAALLFPVGPLRLKGRRGSGLQACFLHTAESAVGSF